MDDDEILERLRVRRSNPEGRIDMDTLAPPALYAPVDDAAVAEAEAALGFAIPTFLSRIYREVGNGGFGPGAGLLGLSNGHVNADGLTLVETYQSFLAGDWPAGLLPLWDWGDAMWSCVDSRSREGTIVTHDETGATRTAFTLPSWLDAWLEGADLFSSIYELEDATMLNPFTHEMVPRKRRGAAIGTR
jgi:hypothetical protein